jgi:single-strand selective monofunctional uracil DNA glycosylase
MLLDILDKLRLRARKLSFGAPVAHVYRPLDYAWPMVEAYVSRFGNGPKEVLFLGMNPGPFGMAQTGVPFGDVVSVRDWMKLDAKVTAPRATHPKRPVLGLDCPRVEVSGRRLWGAVALRHPEPETFFSRAWVMNYCPLLFLGENGANITPDKLVKAERDACEAICDRQGASRAGGAWSVGLADAAPEPSEPEGERWLGGLGQEGPGSRRYPRSAMTLCTTSLAVEGAA